MLGLMRKRHGDQAVVDAVQRMADERPLEPVAWLQGVLRSAPTTKSPPAQSFRERDTTAKAQKAAAWTGGRIGGAAAAPKGEVIDMEAPHARRLDHD